MNYILIPPVCFLIDQLCKVKAEKEMNHRTNKPILSNTIFLKLSYNEGAFMGFLKNNKLLLLIVNIVCLVFLVGLCITYLFVKGEYLLKVALGFMTGGAISNIYDRVKRKKVVDYFSFKWKPTIVFNLADMFVFLGALLLFVRALIRSD